MKTVVLLRLALSLSCFFSFVFAIRLFGVSGPDDRRTLHLCALVFFCLASIALYYAQRRISAQVTEDRRG